MGTRQARFVVVVWKLAHHEAEDEISFDISFYCFLLFELFVSGG